MDVECVCVWLYVFIICASVYMCVCVFLYVCMNVCMYVCLCVCMLTLRIPTSALTTAQFITSQKSARSYCTTLNHGSTDF